MGDKNKKGFKYYLKKTWYFIWEDDSIWSWIVNIVLAYVLIKFIVYPGLGFLLQTSHPIVAVVSGSMEHDGSFDEWWDVQKEWYLSNNITKEEFLMYPFWNGFNKGDIMVLKGKKLEDIKKGDVIVFRSLRPDPIIHRIFNIFAENNKILFQTKGDHNINPIQTNNLDETKIDPSEVIGVAKVKVPYLGYIKIWFVELLRFIGIVE